jgi:hypothetical protein
MSAASLIRKLEQYDRLSDTERQLLEQAVVRHRAEGEDLVREGDRPGAPGRVRKLSANFRHLPLRSKPGAGDATGPLDPWDDRDTKGKSSTST